MNSNKTIRLATAAAAACLGMGLGGCFTEVFDPNASGLYYCQTQDDCESDEVCELNRCVSNDGPQLEIGGPEVDGQEFSQGTASIPLNIRGEGLELVESSQADDGEGFLEVRVDGEVVGNPIVAGDLDGTGETVTLDVSGLSGGAHRLEVQAFQNDDDPYDNPGATARRLFFIDDGMPHVAIVEPAPGSQHRVGETLDLRVMAINFTWKDGEGDNDCTEAQIETGTCNGERTDEGHAHLYTLDNYPECLDPADGGESCNFEYANSLKPDEDGEDQVAGALEFDFEETGTFTISAGLQYNEHEPFPNEVEVVYDQVEIDVIPQLDDLD